MTREAHTAPEGTGDVVLGRTIPSLLDEAVAQNENPHAVRTLERDGTWTSLSASELARHAEQIAAGLLDLGLEHGDRVALHLHSDGDFAQVDLGCLLAGLVDAPIYLTAPDEDIRFILEHTAARVLVVHDAELLDDLRDLVADIETLEHVVVVNPSGVADEALGAADVRSLDDVMAAGRAALEADPRLPHTLREGIGPDDVATIIYTSGTTGRPKGCVLTHENITFDALSAFSGMPDFQEGPDGEVVLSFLPLTHAYARTLHYGFLHTGVTIHFIRPDDLPHMMREVKPTVMATVPRILEKMHERIVEAGRQLSGPRKALFEWSLRLTEHFEVGQRPKGIDSAQLRLADRLVFTKWRAPTGGRLRYVISGGAALAKDLVNAFAAAGIPVLQGYGLTEAGPIVSFNRPDRNRAGTVGHPLAGVEVAVADDGEILTRGPHVMRGYYRNEAATRETIDEEGWLKTGDLGEVLESGHLVIKDRKKNVFKLSSGEFVTPQPLEERLGRSPYVERAVILGPERKFCAAVLFLSPEGRERLARDHDRPKDTGWEELLAADDVRETLRQVVKAANEGLPRWSRVKRVLPATEELTPESDLLTPTLKLKRRVFDERYGEAVDTMYEGEGEAIDIYPEGESPGREREGGER